MIKKIDKPLAAASTGSPNATWAAPPMQTITQETLRTTDSGYGAPRRYQTQPTLSAWKCSEGAAGMPSQRLGPKAAEFPISRSG
jgi:hypothetical protein